MSILTNNLDFRMSHIMVFPIGNYTFFNCSDIDVTVCSSANVKTTKIADTARGLGRKCKKEECLFSYRTSHCSCFSAT